ncbi:hypothetical protein X975_07592, partial [Stegodyphus mimosarum]
MATRLSMCLSRLLKTKSSKFVFASSSTRQISFVKHVKRPSVFISSGALKYCINSNAVFSTQKSNDVKILSEDILKATRPKQTSTSNDEGQSKNSEEDKKSDAFSKKAMKYTFIAFGSMFTGLLGLAVYEWGAPPHDENGNPVSVQIFLM